MPPTGSCTPKSCPTMAPSSPPATTSKSTPSRLCSRTRHQTPLHKALSASDQWKDRALLAHPRRRPHRGNNLRQSRSLRQRTLRVPDLLQQLQTSSGPQREDTKGIRCCQNNPTSISELVNTHNCERSNPSTA